MVCCDRIRLLPSTHQSFLTAAVSVKPSGVQGGAILTCRHQVLLSSCRLQVSKEICTQARRLVDSNFMNDYTSPEILVRELVMRAARSGQRTARSALDE